MSPAPALRLGPARLLPRPSGALWLPEAAILAISDLHLGRAQRGALHGGAALPPYETTETLDRLQAEIDALDPACVVALGDSFDDDGAPARLDPEAAERLTIMASGRDWIWIAGNHDPAPQSLPGAQLAEWRAPDGPVFRHIAEAAEPLPEISGHWHPKARLGKGPSRRCFILSDTKLILPAFGAYAGGLPVDAPPLRALAPEGTALLCRPAAGGAEASLLAAPLSALRALPPRRARRKFA